MQKYRVPSELYFLGLSRARCQRSCTCLVFRVTRKVIFARYADCFYSHADLDLGVLREVTNSSPTLEMS